LEKRAKGSRKEGNVSTCTRVLDLLI
jgi:hypothetical protein